MPLLLLAATAVALVWANVDPNSYASIWHDEAVRTAIGDGLMALFFFSVGLEIKRELVHGTLRDRRVAALPVCAAIGGMVVPALLHASIAGDRGWGVPMATDIAFAVGVLSLLGRRVPPAATVFLLSLAVVDDIGAIVVIAVVYSGGIELLALAGAALVAASSWLARRVEVHSWWLHGALALLCWWALHRAGVHATIAGVAFGLLTPAARTDAPLERLQPLVAWVVLPLFALANAGVELDVGALDGRVVTGVAAGLVLGKPIGIALGGWIGVRSGAAVLPDGITWRLVGAIGTIGGVGFTVALFVAGLAYDDASASATVAVLGASVVAALAGLALTARAVAQPAGSTSR